MLHSVSKFCTREVKELEGSAPPPGVPPPPGFKSPEARKKFFIAAGVAAMAVVALQVLLRVWLSSQLPSAGEARWGVRLENVHAESAAVWRGDLWYVAAKSPAASKAPRTARITGWST